MPRRKAGHYRNLGDRLYRARIERRMSQADVARLADDLSDSFISRVEAGNARPSPETLRLLARKLDLDFNELAVLAGYAEPPVSEELMPVRPGYRRILERLQSRYPADELSRFERAMAALFLRVERLPTEDANGERQDKRGGDAPDAGLDREDIDTG